MNNPTTASIVLVEDDLRLSELVSRYLEQHGFRVSAVSRGDQAVEHVRSENPDLVILDVGLPGQSGFDVCRRLRPEFGAPILMLTARSSDIDHVLGLELGADDYVVKPVDPRVLMARVQALLRRSRAPHRHDRATLEFGRLVVNLVSRGVSLGGVTVALSGNEFELLAHLAKNAGIVQSRSALFLTLYGREYDGVDRMLDVRISNLRRKLGETDGSQRIKTIWGQGYLFVPDAW